MNQLIYQIPPVTWDEVERRMLSHPHEMRLRHLQDILSRKSNPIVPVKFVSSFLSKYAEQLEISPLDKNLLLEAALVNLKISTEVVILLLNVFETTLSDLQRILRNNMSSISSQKWESLVLHSPSILHEADEHGNILLHYICEACLDDILITILQLTKTLLRDQCSYSSGLMINNMNGRTPLDIVLTSLRHRGSTRPWNCLKTCVNEHKNLPLLHSAVRQGVGPNLIKDMIIRFNLDLHKLDGEGKTPLMLAVEKAKSSEIESRFVQERFTPNEIIMTLCKSKQYGREYCRTEDEHGRLPLHIAACMGLTWSKGLREIWYTNRSAIDKEDRETGLLPPMLAAVNKSIDVETIFELLRQTPGSVMRKPSRKKSNFSAQKPWIMIVRKVCFSDRSHQR